MIPVKSQEDTTFINGQLHNGGIRQAALLYSNMLNIPARID